MVWALLPFLISSVYADKFVNLTRLFRPTIQCQVGGTCVTFAVTALAEAECYLRTGKHIDISEGLSLLILMSAWNIDRCDLDAECFRDKNDLFPDDLVATSLNLNRALLNSEGVCTEKVLPFSDVLQFAKETKKLAVTQRAEKLKAWLKNRINDFIARKLKQSNVKATKTKYGVPRPDSPDSVQLRKCLSGGFDIENYDWSKKAARQSLDRGKPLLCRDPYYPKEGRRLNHLTLIIGYREKDGRTEFLFRDSNFSSPRWEVFSDCESFDVVL